MPRLHKRVNPPGYYVLTSIGREVITYQLTRAGEAKLNDAGIAVEQRFDRALLLDLIRTGDAFTIGGSTDGTLPDQMEMDFANDPDAESAFPACDGCGGVSDLHLTLAGTEASVAANLACAGCRATRATAADTSIPLSLVTVALLARLFELKPVAEKSVNVRKFEALLHTEVDARWEALRRQRRAQPQPELFPTSTTDGLVLE